MTQYFEDIYASGYICFSPRGQAAYGEYKRARFSKIIALMSFIFNMITLIISILTFILELSL